jgi:hypothetical protein
VRAKVSGGCDGADRAGPRCRDTSTRGANYADRPDPWCRERGSAHGWEVGADRVGPTEQRESEGELGRLGQKTEGEGVLGCFGFFLLF